ncbi:G-protein coupled receptor 183 [Halichoeres trimaculatus]|uniref:G-protein coupled receptor 183 n=1 Tax=Halichoeres trimaculatus TaxID=147232 RepID=UPI003D9F4CFD
MMNGGATLSTLYTGYERGCRKAQTLSQTHDVKEERWDLGTMAAVNRTLDSAETSNQSSCDVFVYQREAAVLFPVFYSLVFIISACGNSLVLYVICQKKQKFNSTSVYLLNLALSDALFTLTLPGRITYYIRHFDWPFGDLLCRLSTLLFFANTYAGIGFMTCISLDRYLAMVHPHSLQCLRSVKVVRRVCVLVWALVFLQIAPLMFRSMLQEQQSRRTCMEYLSFEGSLFTPYLLLLACSLSFCGPLAVIVGCYAKINLKLRAAAKQSSVSGRSRRSHRANTIILLILLTFIVCFSPYHLNVMQFMTRTIHHRPSCEELRAFKVSLQITVSLMNFNCCLDPVIYFFAIKTYKKRVMSLFRDYLYASSSKATAEHSSSNT